MTKEPAANVDWSRGSELVKGIMDFPADFSRRQPNGIVVRIHESSG